MIQDFHSYVSQGVEFAVESYDCPLIPSYVSLAAMVQRDTPAR
jgi:hypothetical protein